MPAYTFERILERGSRQGMLPGETRKARNWFRDVAQKSRVSPSTLVKEARSQMVNSVEVGKMYCFFYNPKHKDTLPYYDVFPLIFPFRKVPNGFLGINLHYLPFKLRAKLMDSLYGLMNEEKFNNNVRLELSYKILNGTSKFKWFKPCVKHYLIAHVKSRYIEIAPEQWDIALFLNLARFQKATTKRVHEDSIHAI